MVRRVAVFAFFFLLFSTAAFAIPLEMVLENRQEGSLTFFTGKTNLPDGTRIGVTLTKKVGYSARDYEIFVKNGHFETIGFSDRGYRLGGKFELTVISYFNQNWQKPDVLEKLVEYTSPEIKDGRLKIVQSLSFYTGKEKKPGAVQKAELDLFKKHLQTLKEMRAELQEAAKDRAAFLAMSQDWNQRLKKENEAFFGDFGDNVEDYEGGCVNAYRDISLVEGNLLVLWQKYDDFLAGRAETDVLGKMKPDPEMEMDEMMNRAEYSISECSP